MTWLNHAATGAFVAIAIKNPAIALPVALASHFLTDIIPHWDFKYKGGLKQMQAGRLLDLNLAFIFLIIVAAIKLKSAGLVIGCGLLAILPDAIYLPYFLSGKQNKKYSYRVLNTFKDFSHNIQKSETRWGLLVEVGWLILMSILIFEV